MKSGAHGASRVVLIALLVINGAGILVWSTIGGIETLLAFVFNDTGVPIELMSKRVLVMAAPPMLFAASAVFSLLTLDQFSAARFAGATLAFGAALALIIVAPWARSPLDFIVALIEQAR